MTALTVADVVDGALGVELRRENLSFFSSLRREQLIRLGEALKQLRTDGVQVPRASPGTVYHALDPNSPMNEQLGGTGTGFGFRVLGSVDELVGRLSFALMYSPRIVIRDGLAYHLDRYPTGTREAEAREAEVREDVCKILCFYCHVGDMIRDGVLVSVPRGVWHRVESEVRRFPFPAEAKDRLRRAVAREPAALQSFWAESLRAEERTYIERFADLKDHALADEDLIGLVSADWLMLDGLDYFRRLLFFADTYRYQPVLETPLQQALFKHTVQFAGLPLDLQAPRLGVKPVSLPQVRSSTLLPLLSQLAPADLLAARDTDSFIVFREAIETIDREAEALTAKPLALQQMIQERLADAKVKIDREFRGSSFLAKAWKEVRDVSIMAVAGSWFAGQIDPAWVDDPLKLLAVGGIAGAMKLGGEIVPSVSKHRDARTTTRLVVQLQQATR